MDISVNDANILISNIKEWLKKLNILSNLKDYYEQEIYKQIINNEIQENCLALIKSCIENNQYNFNILDFKELFINLNYYQNFLEQIDYILDINNNYYLNITSQVEEFDHITNKYMTKFLFKSFKKKEFELKYSILQKFSASNEYEYIINQYNNFCISNYIEDKDIIDAYQINSDNWWQLLQKISNILQYKSSYLKDIQEKFNKYKIYFNDWSKIFDDNIEKYKNSLKISIDKVTIVEEYKQLDDIPVNDINNDKYKFHINILKENGFNSVGDLYRAPTQAISNIRGISKEQAQQIKVRVNEMMSLLQKKREPLKLNYDERTSCTNEIVMKVYCIKRYLEAQQNYNKLLNITFNNETIKKSYSVISYLVNDLHWIFTPLKYHENFIKAYNILKTFENDLINLGYIDLWNQEESYNINKWALIYEYDAWKDFLENPISYTNCIETILPGSMEDANNRYGLPEELANLIEQETIFPDGLTCELRRYQVWGVKYILHQSRVLLGDEMGLGKTIQAIASMVSLKNVGYDYFIVVCPASVLLNWYREIRKYSKLQAYQAHGNNRDEIVKSWLYNKGVLITTYDTLGNLKIPEKLNIGELVVDEAHYIKNKETKRSKICYKYCEKIDRVLFLTGTPIENNVYEMIALIRVLRPQIADEATRYSSIYLSQRFRDLISPVYFRRKQADVNKELPEKSDNIIWCQLGEEERKQYDNLVLESQRPFMTMRRVSWMMEDLSLSCKAEMLKNLVDNAMKENRKVIVFSYFIDTINKIQSLFGSISMEPISSKINPNKRQYIIDEFTNNPDKYILPAQIIAGGTGLNIQAASIVILCEPQIKPSIEDQAIARSHRMGQSRNVFIYHLCCEDSIDERMLKVLDKKREQFNIFADKSTAGMQSLELSNEDISNIIAEEIKEIKERNGIASNGLDYANTLEGKQFIEEQEALLDITAIKLENKDRKRTVTQSQRYYILNRDLFRCQKCGRYGIGACSLGKKQDDNSILMPNGDIIPANYRFALSLEVDHKNPFSLGGQDNNDNLWTLCDDCNGGKSNKYVD